MAFKLNSQGFNVNERILEVLIAPDTYGVGKVNLMSWLIKRPLQIVNILYLRKYFLHKLNSLLNARSL